MIKILKLKHWQVFLGIILLSFLNDFKSLDASTLNDILTIIQLAVLLFWLTLTGHELYKILPSKIGLNHTLFIINSFLCIVITSTTIIVTESETVTAKGFEAIPGIYLFYAYLHLHAFPVRTLKSIEIGRKANLGEYIGEFFLLLFWPVGIWILQPRINKIAEDYSLSLSGQE